MLYKILPVGETVNEDDVNAGKFWLRPVPEPRPVEDLTEEERGEIYNVCGAGAASVNCIVKTIDEIRSRPRESAKEKWIREQMKVYRDDIEDSKRIEFLFSEIWDTAYAAGREER